MSHPKHERTLAVIKPDGVQRSLVGEVIGRFERVGLKIAAMKMVWPDARFIEAHYTLDAGWKKSVGEKSIASYVSKGGKHPMGDDPMKVAGYILAKLNRYITSGPVIAMVLEGAHAVGIVRKLVGSTEPLSSPVGTIRGDFVIDSYPLSDIDDRAVRNIIHASGTVGEAEQEIRHWFKPSEIIEYDHLQGPILYGLDKDALK